MRACCDRINLRTQNSGLLARLLVVATDDDKFCSKSKRTQFHSCMRVQLRRNIIEVATTSLRPIVVFLPVFPLFGLGNRPFPSLYTHRFGHIWHTVRYDLIFIALHRKRCVFDAIQCFSISDIPHCTTYVCSL